MTAHEKFVEIANKLPDCNLGKMFGKECIKAANGKALAIFFHDDMVFKLKDNSYDEAMALDGAAIFAPAKGRPMNGWVQLPFEYVGQWIVYAEYARKYVAALPENKKKKK